MLALFGPVSLMQRVLAGLFVGVFVGGCAWPVHFLPPQKAAFASCRADLVEQYFRRQPAQSVDFERRDMVKFISQFEVCKHDFILAVPTFRTVDGRDVSFPYRVVVDTSNNPTLSGCIRRETVTFIPLTFREFCFVDGEFVESERNF